MHYTITALTNDRSRLIVDKTTTTIEALRVIIKNYYIAQGYLVLEEVEE